MTTLIGLSAPRHDGDTTWIRRFHPANPGATTLLCFPHAGGSASSFFGLSRALTPGIEVLTAQYPGRQDRRREPVVDRIETLADRVCEALRGWTGRRLVLFGHSMGASVAFETARRLEQGGGPAPELLITSARQAPSRPTTGNVHRRDDAGIVAELKRLGGTAAALFDDPELLAAAMPAIRGDYAALETYQAAGESAVGCPILALGADADPLTGPVAIEAWSGHTSADFEMRMFPGGHFYLEDWPAPVVELIRARVGALR